MPRVLISYFFSADSIPLGASCARAFERLGWTVARFHSQCEHPLERHAGKHLNRLLKTLSDGRVRLSPDRATSNDRYRERRLETAIAGFRPDLLLVIRGNGYAPEFLAQVKRRYGIARTAGWWVKDPRAGPEMLEDARAYDTYFCIHEHQCRPEDNVYPLPAAAVDSELYRPATSRREQDLAHHLVQVGGYGVRRHRYLAACAQLPLEIYGPGWRKGRRWLDPLLRRAWAGRGVWGDDLLRLYQTSRIVINVTNWERARHTGQNLRIMDVPATGALLLTDESDEVRSYFTPGTELDTFGTPEELADKARFYLANPGIREAVARRGCERTLALPTYVDRMRRLVEVSRMQ